MRMALRRLGTGLGVAALLAACGGDSDSDIADSSVPLADLPAPYAGAACQAAPTSYGTPDAVFTAGEDCAET